jgi:hypothetical protein
VVNPYPTPRPAPSKAWWVVLAVLVAAILVGIGVLIGQRGSNDNGTTSPPTHSTSAPATSGPASTTPSTSSVACPPFRHSPRDVPITAPAATWIQRGIITVPTSVTGPGGQSVNGPAIATSSRPLACFAHTPTGALFAAAAAAGDALDPPVLLQWTQQRVTGPGQQAAIHAAANVSTTATSDGRNGRIVGFRMVNCSDRDRCVIDIAATVNLTDGTTATTVGTGVMVWRHGDWLYLDDGISDPPRYLDGNDLMNEGFVPRTP